MTFLSVKLSYILFELFVSLDCRTALIAIQFRVELGTIPDEASQKFASLQTDSAPIGSGDRVKRRLSEGAAPRMFQSDRRCVETSGDVIEQALPTSGKIVERYLR